MTTTPRIYGYVGCPTRPLGWGIDQDGEKPGTRMLEAFDRLATAGVDGVLAHNLPPAPGTALANLAAAQAIDVARAQEKPDVRLRSFSRPHDIMECDGSYESAIQEVLADHQVVAGSSLNTIARYLVACGTDCSQAASGRAIVDLVPTPRTQAVLAARIAVDQAANQPALAGGQKVGGAALSPLAAATASFQSARAAALTLQPSNGDPARLDSWAQALDIWDPRIVDVLAEAYTAVAYNRPLAGLWLSLGGAMIWGLTNTIASREHCYHVDTPAAQEALGRSGPIDMRVEGRHYTPILAARLARIAGDLVQRLMPICRDFYFQTYAIPSDAWRPVYQAAGVVGVTEQLCQRLSDIDGITAHMVVSKASEHSAQSGRHAQELIRRFPRVEFIAGVGWEQNLRFAGPSRLADGYHAVEVGMLDRESWYDLPTAVTQVRSLSSLLQ